VFGAGSSFAEIIFYTDGELQALTNRKVTVFCCGTQHSSVAQALMSQCWPAVPRAQGAWNPPLVEGI
jgi:hypothetical protein